MNLAKGIVNHTKTATLTTIAVLIRKYGNNWCTASQEKLLELLRKYHKTEINIRMLNYHMADLRRAGLIQTIQRTRENDDGKMRRTSSATCLTMKGCYYLGKLGVGWAWKLAQRLRAKYLPNCTPQKTSISEPFTDPQPADVKLFNPFKDPDARVLMGLSPIVPPDKYI